MMPSLTLTPAKHGASRFNTRSRLASLPEELLSNIAARLGSDSIFHFRLTCRAVEAKTQHEFAQEYFGSKCFMFTTESLETLEHIAKSTKLRNTLRRIYIITARFLPLHEDDLHGKRCQHRRPVRHLEAHQFYVSDQNALRTTGNDLRMLTRAFSLLKNVTELIFVDSLLAVPMLVDCRGEKKAARVTGMPLLAGPVYGNRLDFDYFVWLRHVWTTTLKAVTRSGLDTLERLETSFQEGKHGLSAATELLFQSGELDRLATAMRNLKAVNLSLRSRHLRERREKPHDCSIAEQNLGDFASVLQSVTDFGLVIDHHDTTSALICNKLVSSLNLENMKTLRLDGASFDHAALTKVVSKLKTVKTLFFTHVDLDGSWVPTLRAIQKLPALEHLHMMFLSEAQRKAFFLTQPEADDLDPDGGPDYDDDGFPYPLGESESDDDTSDGIPDVLGSAPNSPPAKATGPAKTGSEDHDMCSGDRKTFRSPSAHGDPSRGYYICLHTAREIAQYLPIFISEYNTGELAYAGVHAPPAIGLNHFLNSIFPPPPPPFPAGPGLMNPLDMAVDPTMTDPFAFLIPGPIVAGSAPAAAPPAPNGPAAAGGGVMLSSGTSTGGNGGGPVSHDAEGDGWMTTDSDDEVEDFD